MNAVKASWTQAHDLALIFLALAYGTDEDLTDDELATITDVLQDWRDDFPADEAQDVVMEAIAVLLEDDADDEVIRAIDQLRQQLALEERRRALEDVMRIAEADGVLLSTEQSLIHRLAEAWELRSIGERLIDQTSARLEEEPAWTLLHDMSLLGIVMAHTTDDRISEGEIAAMIERLGDWEPGLEEAEIRRVLREALAVYAKGPDQETLQSSIQTIRRKLPIVHLLVLLDDLAYIAQTDGGLGPHGEELLSSLAQAWGVGIRVNGRDKAG